MPLGTNSMFAVILPVEKINLASNPSFERGTAGVDAIQPGAVGSVASLQQFGAWSCAVTLSANGTGGAAFDLWTAGNGTSYTVSFYGRVPNGVPFKIAVGNASGASLVGSADYTGGGTWQRYSCSYTESTGATRRPVFKKAGDTTTGTAYFDGMQVEVGSLTTYIDGDQEGCTWFGAPHKSQSYRSGQSRAGGSVVALADLGFRVDEASGIGMAPLETSSQSYALMPGAEFQSQRAEVRPFVLSTQMSGTTWRDFHNTRRTVINALKIDAVAEPQPIRFWYVGGEGTMQIDAVIDAGMEGGNRSGFTESYGVRFLAHDPYWKATTNDGTTLPANTNIGSVRHIAYRDPLGRWGTMGNAGTAASGFVNTICVASSGSVFVGGGFAAMGGTTANYIAVYTPSLNTWGTLAGGAINAGWVNRIVEGPDSNLYVAIEGSAAVSGTTARGLAIWNTTTNAWGTFANGGVAGGGTIVRALYYSGNGTMYVGGAFTSVAGTSAGSVAQYDPINRRWGTMSSGGSGGAILDIAGALNGDVYVVGNFVKAGGTIANSVAQWIVRSNNWGTLSTGVTSANKNVNGAAVASDGRLYVGGDFGTIGGGSASAAGVWNGLQWQALGSGFDAGVFSVSSTRIGDVYFGGVFGSADGKFAPTAGRWNGYTFLPLDLVGLSQADDIILAGNGTLYIGFEGYANAGTAASVTQVVNTGMSEAYPILRVLNTGGITAPIRQLVNTTIGASIYFNDLTIQPGEEIVLGLQPGSRSFQSSFQGNIFGKIMTGSNLATWRLLPGTNYVSFLAESGTVQTSFYWQPRSWSADGTIE